MADTETPAADAAPAAKTATGKKSGATVAVHPVDSAVPGTDVSTAQKVSVKTTGEFQLIDPFTFELVPHDDSAEVTKTQFIIDALEDGRLVEA